MINDCTNCKVNTYGELVPCNLNCSLRYIKQVQSNKNFTQEEWAEFHGEGNETEYEYYSTKEYTPSDITKAEDGKQKPSLAGLPPKVLEQVAEVMSFGASKYYFGKWLKEPTTQYKRVDSALRHINKWLQGVDVDDESGLPHLVHAIVQLTMSQEYANRGIDDGR